MKVVYIAGPFTAPTAWGIESNIRGAEMVAFEIALRGAMPLCPHTNTRYFHGTCTPEFWYAGTMELLKRCDAVMLTPNWTLSEGAKREWAYAKEHKIPVFHYPDEASFLAWLKGEK